jgi:ankyrin repeat protein
LIDAAYHGEQEILTFLLDSGAGISHTSRDGNTPLHTAAFLCRTEAVKLLLERGSSLEIRNHRRETPIDVVSSDWSEPLARFYGILDKAGDLNLDMEKIRKTRPELVKLLQNHAVKSH